MLKALIKCSNQTIYQKQMKPKFGECTWSDNSLLISKPNFTISKSALHFQVFIRPRKMHSLNSRNKFRKNPH